MSRENVEIVRRAFEAFQRDGIEGILPFLDEEIELKGTFSSCCASDSQGREAASSWTFVAIAAERNRVPDRCRPGRP